MQTIARANRVFGDKHNGLIVDYVGVFRDLQRALAIYGSASISTSANIQVFGNGSNNADIYTTGNYSGPRTFQWAPGVRFYFAETGRTKLFSTAQLAFDFTGYSAVDSKADFFLRKAIGWALREYGKAAPTEVAGYVAAHARELSPLSRREALKYPASTA